LRTERIKGIERKINSAEGVKICNRREKTVAKPNLADEYFKRLIGKEVTFELVSLRTITGVIKQVGIYTLLLEIDKRSTLLFKHAIEKVELPKVWTAEETQKKEG